MSTTPSPRHMQICSLHDYTLVVAGPDLAWLAARCCMIVLLNFELAGSGCSAEWRSGSLARSWPHARLHTEPEYKQPGLAEEQGYARKGDSALPVP